MFFVLLKGTNVILEAKEDPPADRQKWKRSTPDNEGWFTLQNPNSERYLTAISAVNTIISGKEYSFLDFIGKISTKSFPFLHISFFNTNVCPA